MRPEKNTLDLNNLPEDYTRDGKQVFEGNSSAGHRKKKTGANDEKDECGKVYECRFCSVRFPKPQALGGHMNRHRQERETETLNKARQLVFHNDLNLHPQAPPHLGRHPTTPAGHNELIWPPRQYLPASSSTIISPPPPQATMNEHYVSHVISSWPDSQYPPPHHCQNRNDMGASGAGAGAAESNYTCAGATVGQGFVVGAPASSRGSDHMAGGSSSGGDRE